MSEDIKSDPAVCPACHQRMLLRHGVRLPPRCADIYDVIANSGKRGIPCETLSWVFFPGQATRAAKKCIAVHVNRLNDFLEPTDVMISGGRWRPYRVVGRRL